MEPIFILSYPRSRTAWLATYLTGGGVFAFHEAWKLVKNAKDLRALMESKGPGPVVNVDCANWIFLKEIKAEFPEACFIEIQRERQEVEASLTLSYGEADYGGMFLAYDRARERAGDTCWPVIPFQSWTSDVSLAIWQYIAGEFRIDPHWHAQMHGLLVELLPAQIKADIALGQSGELNHVIEAMAK